MQTQGNIKNDIIVQLGISTTVAFYTDTILDNWIDKAHKWAAGYHKWPFTEGKVSTTYVADSTTYEVGFSYPEGWKPDSIRMLRVGEKRFKKTNFYRYQEFREDSSSDQSKIFSDFALTYYINPNADVSGTTVLWGQYTPITLDATDTTANTVFSLNAEEGNEALILEVMSYAKLKEKKVQESQEYHEKAKMILEELWKRVQDEQFGYQDTNGDGIFKRFDVVHGDFNDVIVRRNQWF